MFAHQNPIIGMIHNRKLNRWHPALYLESPLPGPPNGDKSVRHKSKMHHTAGFATREEAIKNAMDDLAPKCECRQFALEEDIEWDGEDVPAEVAFFTKISQQAGPITNYKRVL